MERRLAVRGGGVLARGEVGSSGDLHGAQHCPCLVQALLKLARWIRIGHDSRSRLQVRVLSPHEQSANADAGIEIAGKVGVENRSAIDAAADRLEFFDDLHGAHLRRTAYRPGGKARRKTANTLQI